MDSGWWSALDSRERYIYFICDLGDLTDHTFCSGLWEEYPMVCRSSNLQYQENLLFLLAPQLSTMSGRCATTDWLRWRTFILTFEMTTRNSAATFFHLSLSNSPLVLMPFVTYSPATTWRTTTAGVRLATKI